MDIKTLPHQNIIPTLLRRPWYNGALYFIKGFAEMFSKGTWAKYENRNNTINRNIENNSIVIINRVCFTFLLHRHVYNFFYKTTFLGFKLILEFLILRKQITGSAAHLGENNV